MRIMLTVLFFACAATAQAQDTPALPAGDTPHLKNGID